MALALSPGHPKASVGAYALALQSGDQAEIGRARVMATTAIDALIRAERHVEAALVSAGKQTVEDHTNEAVETLDRLLTTAPAGLAGWIIPIDPMLAAIRETPGRQALFSKLAARSA